MSTWISVDVEADGPCPGLFSMVSFGAVVVDQALDKTFYGKTAPITSNFIPEALAVSGHSRKEHLVFPHPTPEIQRFHDWLTEIRAQDGNDGRLVFVSDNPAFDWQFINYYLHRYCGSNPFGFSARRIGDLYAGWKGDAAKSNDWKKLRKTKHTHNPVDDAKGNAEALLVMKERGLKLPF